MFGMINVVTYDGTDAYCMKFIAEVERKYVIDYGVDKLIVTDDAKKRITEYCEYGGVEVIKFDVKSTVSHKEIVEYGKNGTAEEKAAVDRFEQMYF